MSNPSENPEFKYDVCLSFAGEQRDYVAEVAQRLIDAGVRVFYDDAEKIDLWGKDLYVHLDWIYRKAARYCVLFASDDYAKKVWTNHERQSAQARAIEENTEYILPVRFDDTEVPGPASHRGLSPCIQDTRHGSFGRHSREVGTSCA